MCAAAAATTSARVPSRGPLLLLLLLLPMAAALPTADGRCTAYLRDQVGVAVTPEAGRAALGAGTPGTAWADDAGAAFRGGEGRGRKWVGTGGGLGMKGRFSMAMDEASRGVRQEARREEGSGGAGEKREGGREGAGRVQPSAGRWRWG